MENNSVISPLVVFNYYLAIKLHFTNDKYDATKYGSCSRYTVDTLNKRRDRNFFVALSKRFKSRADLFDFFCVNFANHSMNDQLWIGDFVQEETRDVHQRVFKQYIFLKESLQRRMEDCIIHLRDKMILLSSSSLSQQKTIESPSMLFFGPNEEGTDYPVIVNEMRRGAIPIELVILLDRHINFLRRLDDTIGSTNFIWRDYYKRLIKYNQLLRLKMDEKTLNSIMLRVFRPDELKM